MADGSVGVVLDKAISNSETYPCPGQGGRLLMQNICRGITSSPVNNKRFCVQQSCACKWRLCWQCVQQGVINESARISDLKQGLCVYHVQHGVEWERPRSIPLNRPHSMYGTREVGRQSKRNAPVVMHKQAPVVEKPPVSPLSLELGKAEEKVAPTPIPTPVPIPVPTPPVAVVEEHTQETPKPRRGLAALADATKSRLKEQWRD
jgi:hypothetical protein